MSVTVVVGGQYGSEGKGKAVSLLAGEHRRHCAVVRCGGPNSGHIVVEHDREYCFRLLPAGVVYGCRGFLAPAALVDIEVLRGEIQSFGVTPDLFAVDPFSAVISDEMKAAEQGLVKAISSTGSGTGAATAAKCLRSPTAKLIKDVVEQHAWLKPFVRDVRSEVHALIESGWRIIVEGTQGLGLSLHHSRMYPHTTSKDTTAAQFIMEAGLSPRLVDEIVVVVRTFPIRVAGEQAGPLQDEITWDDLRRESGYPEDLTELTTVTRKQRRVGRFDIGLVMKACQINRPTSLVVHGLDYLGFENLGVTQFSGLNARAKRFLESVRKSTDVPIKYAFTGRDNACVVADVEAGLQSGNMSIAVPEGGGRTLERPKAHAVV
jgi:adenylosuccinate synthase